MGCIGRKAGVTSASRATDFLHFDLQSASLKTLAKTRQTIDVWRVWLALAHADWEREGMFLMAFFFSSTLCTLAAAATADR